MNEKKYILLLGGTGAMGKHLVELLSKDSNNICYVTSRSEHRDSNNVKFIKGNAHLDEFVKPLLNSRLWDAIIDFMIYRDGELEKRIESILSSTEQFFFLSSARVYADCDGFITEDSPRLLDVCQDKEYIATNEYAIEKAKHENILFNHVKKNWTIIRPYITYSEIRMQLGVLEKEYWLYRATKGRPILFSKDIAKCNTTLTYGYDVARGIAALVGQEKALGQAFHITTPEYRTWNQLLEIYLSTYEEITGVRPKVVYTDLTENLKYGNKYQVYYDRYYNRRFDNTKISQFVDVNSFLTPEQGLRKSLTEFLHAQKFSYIDLDQETFKDDITGSWNTIIELPSAKLKLRYLLHRLGLRKIKYNGFKY